MVTRWTPAPVEKSALRRMSAINRRCRDGKKAIDALIACLNLLKNHAVTEPDPDRDNENDFCSEDDTPQQPSKSENFLSQRGRDLRSLRSASPSSLKPSSQVDSRVRHGENLPEPRAENGAELICWPPATSSSRTLVAMEASQSGDSGYSSDSSEREPRNDDDDDHREALERWSAIENDDIDRRSKKVTFADEHRLPLVHSIELHQLVTRSEIQDNLNCTSALISQPTDSNLSDTDNCCDVGQGRGRAHTHCRWFDFRPRSTDARVISNCGDLIKDCIGSNGGLKYSATYDSTRRNHKQVSLESISLDVGRRRLKGSVFVRLPASNLSPSTLTTQLTESSDTTSNGRELSKVYIRMTSDNWNTQADVPAEFRCRLRTIDNDRSFGFADVYVFEIELQKLHRKEYLPKGDDDAIKFASLSTVIQFAVTAISRDEKHQVWDNNNGEDYSVQVILVP